MAALCQIEKLVPVELGLPEKFDRWRPNQEDCIHSLLTSPKRASVVSAPTGYGKTLTYIGYALAAGKRTCVLTSTRGLADQLLADFGEVGLVDIRGRANYTCGLKPDFSCEEGRAVRCPYWGSVACPYSQAEMQARIAPLVVTNYPKWMSNRSIDSPFKGFDILICDEAHTAVEALASSMQITLNYKETEETLKVPFLIGPDAEEFVNWKQWARCAETIAADKMMEAAKKLESPDPKVTWIKHYNHMHNIHQRLSILASANSKDWVADRTEYGWQFDPIRPARYAEIKLFCRVPRIIMVSATIRPKTMFMLGMGQDRFDFLEYPSDFDISRCPTYHIPTLRNDHRVKDFSMLYLKADQIMSRRGDRKGIIHTISWNRREEVLGSSRYADRMIVNNKGESPTAAIESFKLAPAPMVLVSPSVSTGYDFPGQDAEYQIILKVPFPDGRSKIMKARQADDPEYGAYQAMQDLVQMVGRLMRSKSDRGESFILDDHIGWFKARYGHFAPKSFHKYFREISVVPPPPPKL